MSRQIRKDLKLLTHPYIFVLKEGKTMGKNPMDFSLLMFQMTCPEVIKSRVIQPHIQLSKSL